MKKSIIVLSGLTFVGIVLAIIFCVANLLVGSLIAATVAAVSLVVTEICHIKAKRDESYPDYKYPLATVVFVDSILFIAILMVATIAMKCFALFMAIAAIAAVITAAALATRAFAHSQDRTLFAIAAGLFLALAIIMIAMLGWVFKFNQVGQEIDLVVNSLNVVGDANVEGSLNIGGDTEVDGDANIGGNANVDGDANIGGNANVNGDANVDGDANIGGNANVDGDVNVGGTINVPTTIEPTTQKPAPTEPTTQKPDTTEPMTQKPDTTEPTTQKPDTTEPTTQKPAPTEPTTQKTVTLTGKTEVRGGEQVYITVEGDDNVQKSDFLISNKTFIQDWGVENGRLWIVTSDEANCYITVTHVESDAKMIIHVVV